MPPSIEPREVEPIPVTLARIEGSVSGVAKDIAHVLEKVEDHGAEIVRHRGQIGELQSDLQQIRSDQLAAGKDLLAADKARQDLAAALEKQTASKVAEAKAAVDQSTQRWTPMMRVYATILALAGAVAIVLGVVNLFFSP